MEPKIDRIEKLLERYFEGETTRDEELELRAFFAAGDVPASLRYAQAMFGGMAALASDQMPRRIPLAIEPENRNGTPLEQHTISRPENPALARPETSTSRGPIPGFAEPESGSIHAAQHRKNRGRRIRLWTAGAAAAVVAAGCFALVEYLNRPYCYIDGVPVHDARVAMQTTVYFERLGDMDKPLDALDDILEQLKTDRR